MSITIRPEFEGRLRTMAAAEGVSAEEYLESLIQAQEEAQDALERLAIEGLSSGDLIKPGTQYWEEKHRQLEERLQESS